MEQEQEKKLPSLEEMQQAAAAALKLAELAAPTIEAHLRTSFYLFLSTVVYTFDSHKPAGQQVNQLPKYVCFRELAYLFQRAPLLAVYKSRQLMMSWMLAAYAIWTCLYKGDAAWVIIQSRTEDEAKDLLKRCVFIYNTLPPWLKTRHKLTRPPTETDMRFRPLESGPGARISAVAQGAHVIRSRTPTLVLSDEMAFQEEFVEAYPAIRPAIEGGGQWIGVSTPNGREEWGAKLWHDDPDTYHPAFCRSYNVEVDLHRGLSVSFNRNGIVAVRYHYPSWPSRDPQRTKQGYQWYVRARAGMAKSKWMREYEIDFDTMEGRPVYPDFKKSLHSRQKLDFMPGMTVYRGWDYGYHHPACVIAQKTADDRLMVIFELVGKDIPIQIFADAVLWVCGQNLSRQPEAVYDFATEQEIEDINFRRVVVQSRRLEKLEEAVRQGRIIGYQDISELPRFDMQNCKFVDYDDPAGMQKSDKTEITSREVLVKRGIYPSFGEMRSKKRRASVTELLLPRHGDKRAWLVVSREGCPILYRGFLGGYVFRKDTDDPEKNVYSHPHDALQYIASKEYELEVEDLAQIEPKRGSFAYMRRQMEKARMYAEMEI